MIYRRVLIEIKSSYVSLGHAYSITQLQQWDTHEPAAHFRDEWPGSFPF